MQTTLKDRREQRRVNQLVEKIEFVDFDCLIEIQDSEGNVISEAFSGEISDEKIDNLIEAGENLKGPFASLDVSIDKAIGKMHKYKGRGGAEGKGVVGSIKKFGKDVMSALSAREGHVEKFADLISGFKTGMKYVKRQVDKVPDDKKNGTLEDSIDDKFLKDFKNSIRKQFGEISNIFDLDIQILTNEIVDTKIADLSAYLEKINKSPAKVEQAPAKEEPKDQGAYRTPANDDEVDTIIAALQQDEEDEIIPAVAKRIRVKPERLRKVVNDDERVANLVRKLIKKMPDVAGKIERVAKKKGIAKGGGGNAGKSTTKVSYKAKIETIANEANVDKNIVSNVLRQLKKMGKLRLGEGYQNRALSPMSRLILEAEQEGQSKEGQSKEGQNKEPMKPPRPRPNPSSNSGDKRLNKPETESGKAEDILSKARSFILMQGTPEQKKSLEERDVGIVANRIRDNKLDKLTRDDLEKAEEVIATAANAGANVKSPKESPEWKKFISKLPKDIRPNKEPKPVGDNVWASKVKDFIKVLIQKDDQESNMLAKNLETIIRGGTKVDPKKFKTDVEDAGFAEEWKKIDYSFKKMIEGGYKDPKYDMGKNIETTEQREDDEALTKMIMAGAQAAKEADKAQQAVINRAFEKISFALGVWPGAFMEVLKNQGSEGLEKFVKQRLENPEVVEKIKTMGAEIEEIRSKFEEKGIEVEKLKGELEISSARYKWLNDDFIKQIGVNAALVVQISNATGVDDDEIDKKLRQLDRQERADYIYDLLKKIKNPDTKKFISQIEDLKGQLALAGAGEEAALQQLKKIADKIGISYDDIGTDDPDELAEILLKYSLTGNAKELADTTKRLGELEAKAEENKKEIERLSGEKADLSDQLLANKGALERLKAQLGKILPNVDTDNLDLDSSENIAKVLEKIAETKPQSIDKIKELVAKEGRKKIVKELEGPTGISAEILAKVVDKIPNEMLKFESLVRNVATLHERRVLRSAGLLASLSVKLKTKRVALRAWSEQSLLFW